MNQISALLLLITLPMYAQPWDPDADLYQKTRREPHSEQLQGLDGRTAAVWAITLFQNVISAQDGSVCHYHPTCTAYGKLAIKKYGVLIGSLMAADRLIRDNPFSPPAVDYP